MALKTWTCHGCGRKVEGDEAAFVLNYIVQRLEQSRERFYELLGVPEDDKHADFQTLVTDMARQEGLGRCRLCILEVDFSPERIVKLDERLESLEAVQSALFVWREVTS